MPDQASSQPRLLPTHTPALFAAAVAEAALLLRRGEVVVVPTETVYGLAANALDPRAVARIFEIKGRPAHNPVIVHIVGQAMARQCAGRWPEAATQLAAAFWPGPLTLVVERDPSIPDTVTAGGPTVGLRWPSHPFIQALIQACAFPVAAPSANISNQLSPTNAQHALRSLGGRVPLVVDGGQSQVGIESTVVDVTSPSPRVLRPGMISLEAILTVTGTSSADASDSTLAIESDATVPRSPGQLHKHYAPRARLVVWHWRDDDELRAMLSEAGVSASECHIIAHTKVPSTAGFTLSKVAVIPHDAEAYARALYAELHRCDEEGARTIVVEAVPETEEWKGIADRLRRAAK